MNQRIFMQIVAGSDYWFGANSGTHPTHPTFWSEIRNLTQKVSMSIDGVNSSGGPQASGRIAHDDIEVIKDVDRMSPNFLDFCCRGQGLDSVIIEVFDLARDRSTATDWAARAAIMPSFRYILRGVSLTSHKITGVRTSREKREYNLAQADDSSGNLITGYTESAYDAPYTVARETVTLLYSDIYFEIFSGNTSQKANFWDATKNAAPPKSPSPTVSITTLYKDPAGTEHDGRFYSVS